MTPCGDAMTNRRRGVRSILSLMSVTLTVALVVCALMRFTSVAVRPDGALAGALLLLIGTIVGSIIGTQPIPRYVTIGVNLLLFICLVNDVVKHVGDPLTRWTFVCMNIGLLVGAIHLDLQGRLPDQDQDP